MTGAGGGIGRAVAHRLVQGGASVILTDRRSPDAVAGELGERALALAADVRDSDALRNAVTTATERFGGLDVVSINHGIFSAIGKTWEVADEDWQQVLDINLTGTFKTVKAAAPALIERGGGSVVVMSSVGAMVGVRRTAAYATSKHGLAGLVKVLANDLGEHNVRVNSVHPAMVATDMVHSEEMLRRLVPRVENPTIEDLEDLQRRDHTLDVPWVEPEDVAEAVHFLASDASRHLSGVQLPVDAGYLVKT